MKKIFRSVAALAVVMFAGCTTDITDGVVAPLTGETTTITVGFDETKTSLGELVDGVRKVYWSTGDQIATNGVTSAAAVINEDNKGVAEFTFESALTLPYSTLYPAAAYVDAQTINLPVNQGRGLENVASNALPMAGYATTEGEGVVLHHLAGAFRFRIKQSTNDNADAHEIHHVELRGNNDEQLSGNFAIDYASATLTSTSTAEADKVAYSTVSKATSAESEMNIFVVVPARTYEQGITLRIVDAAGHYMDVKSSAMTIAKGEIKAMPVVEFVPTGTLINVEIKSAADLLAFAQDYNAGKYFNVNPFVIEIAEDIVFDDATNAAWEPIGCKFAKDSDEYSKYGETNYFHGYFEGNNHSIKNWVTSQPLFAYTGGGSTVKNLNIDASCTLTVTPDKAVDNSYFAGFVGYHRGEIVGCANNAAIAASGEWANDTHVGGIVGRSVIGTIENCTMNGAITVDETFLVTKDIYVGGVCARNSNADGEIKSSAMNGNITFAGNTTASGYLGGITGYITGSIDNCTTLLNSKIDATHATNNVKNFYVGGLVGYIHENGDVANSTNNATVVVKYQRNSDATRNIYIGGIAGRAAKNSSVVNCSNNHTIQTRSASKTIAIGGVIGWAEGGATINKCHNTYEVNARTSSAGSYGGRYLYLGGVIGSCNTSNVSEISNSATIEASKTENNLTANICIGGCIGELKVALDGQNTITNSGTVSFSDTSANRSYLGLGGVVGVINAAGANLSNVSNSGKVTDSCATAHTNAFIGGVVGLINQPATVSSVSNSGAVSFTDTAATQQTNVGMGGIVGGGANYTYVDSTVTETLHTVTITNSTNTGTVARATSSKLNGSHFCCGGIMGILKGSNSSVTGCTNSANVTNGNFNNSVYDANLSTTATAGSSVVGGIVGYACGDAEGLATISNCTNKDMKSKSQRGYNGGIVGYARYAAVSTCNSTNATIEGTNTNGRVGGIAGYINASTISSCNASGTVDGVSTSYAGGIAGGMNATSSIVSSTINGTITMSNGTTNGIGVIVALAEAGATITDCGAKGEIGFKDAVGAITTDAFDGSGKATVTGAYILE